MSAGLWTGDVEHLGLPAMRMEVFRDPALEGPLADEESELLSTWIFTSLPSGAVGAYEMHPSTQVFIPAHEQERANESTAGACPEISSELSTRRPYWKILLWAHLRPV